MVYIAVGFLGMILGSVITMFMLSTSRSNREHDIYVEGYIEGAKAKEKEYLLERRGKRV